MNKFLLVAVGLAFTFIVGGCAHDPQFREFGVRTASVAYVSVQVVGDPPTIVVSQEPIYVQQDEDNAIYWSLPSGGLWYFPSAHPNLGIDFDSPAMPQTRCDLYNQDKYKYVCTYKKANKKKYHYTVRVTKNGTDIIKSDPTVVNN